MKSVPNLISYLHEFFQNFSQSLAICFELFSFRVIFNSEIADSGPHLSGAARPDTTPHARSTAPASRVSPPLGPPRRPHRRPDRSLARRRRAVVRRPRAGEPPPRVAPPWAVHTGRTPCGHGPCPRCATGPSVISAQCHPVKIYYFLIYSIRSKFKNLCMIH
jgi:hypothetical protein